MESSVYEIDGDRYLNIRDDTYIKIENKIANKVMTKEKKTNSVDPNENALHCLQSLFSCLWS